MLSAKINSVEQLSEDLWVITETESIHCYLLTGGETALLIDCGYGYEDIHPILHAITAKPVMTVLTHGDADHCLGARHFSLVWIHPLDYGKMLKNDTYDVKKTALAYRLRKMPELKGVIVEKSFCEGNFEHSAEVGFLLDGQMIDLGGRHVECILVPGHSYGHLMFLERETGRLFSGDQITDGHNIWHFLSRDEQAPFAMTLQSLQRLSFRRDEIRELFPAHGKTPAGITCLDDLIECLQNELKENYRSDVLTETFQGNAYQHRFRSVNLLYSDERLAEYLGHPVIRT